MVKVGFIVEDKPFEMIVSSENFKALLTKNNIEEVGVHNIKGRDNLRNENDYAKSMFRILEDNGAEKIFVITDKEDDPCITESKNNIFQFSAIQTSIIASKAVESWFLADTVTLATLFNNPDFNYELPEQTEGQPFDELKKLFLEYTSRGINKKQNRHAKRIIREGFSVENAAKHPNCPSAKYFIDKLENINN